MNQDLARIARIVALLRAGREIEVAPTEGRRGYTIAETLRYGPGFDRGMDLHMRSTMVHVASGRTTTSRWEPLPWSVGDLLVMSAWWPGGTVPDDVADPVPTRAAAFLRGLDETGAATMAGYGYRLVPHAPTEGEPWTATIERDENRDVPDHQSALDLVSA